MKYLAIILTVTNLATGLFWLVETEINSMYKETIHEMEARMEFDEKVINNQKKVIDSLFINNVAFKSDIRALKEIIDLQEKKLKRLSFQLERANTVIGLYKNDEIFLLDQNQRLSDKLLELTTLRTEHMPLDVFDLPFVPQEKI